MMEEGHAVPPCGWCADGLWELLVWKLLLGRRAEIWLRTTRSNSFQLSSAHCILAFSYCSRTCGGVCQHSTYIHTPSRGIPSAWGLGHPVTISVSKLFNKITAYVKYSFCWGRLCRWSRLLVEWDVPAPLARVVLGQYHLGRALVYAAHHHHHHYQNCSCQSQALYIA